MKHKAAHPLLGLSFGPYSPKCVEGLFCELPLYGVIRSSALMQKIVQLSDTFAPPGLYA